MGQLLGGGGRALPEGEFIFSLLESPDWRGYLELNYGYTGGGRMLFGRTWLCRS